MARNTSHLLVNDYAIIEWAPDHEEFVELLAKALDAGAEIDGLGVQAHDVYRDSEGAGVAVAKRYLDAFTERFGLPIYVTEFDIDLADDAAQLAVMQEAMTMFWEHENVYGITCWGTEEGRTWRPNAHLIRADGSDRPAMTWLREFIDTHRAP